MRIGLFGGTFDPPHRGHLAAATAARDRFSLDRVLLAPAAIQPLKPDGALASFADRLRMVELLCQDVPGLEASTLDAPRPDRAPNYTIDSIRTLSAQLSTASQSHAAAHPAAELFVLVGADAFLDIHQWRDPAALLREARWIVISRPGFDLSTLNTLGLTPAQRANVETLPDFADPTSATEIRERLRHHAPLSALVPPPVLDYIHTHHLYGS